MGNNTAHGFMGNYEQELKDKDIVVLLKGGPGTGKSTILKRIAAEAEKRGYAYEKWYCSGDPKSLDGVFVKDLNRAVVDATAPHATGADLPVVKDVIVDLASSLERDKLQTYANEIKRLLSCKKHEFMRVYHHLKLAFCHFENKIALETSSVSAPKIRAIAVDFARRIVGETGILKAKRKLFASAICPTGESVFYDFLHGKKIFKLKGSDCVANIFFEQLASLFEGGTYILKPLEPRYIDGIVLNDVAVVKDVGFETDFEEIDLTEFEKFDYPADLRDEQNGETLETAFAVEHLNRAREFHLEAEKYFVGAMNWDKNERLYQKVFDAVFS